MHKVDYARQELVWQLKTICRYKDGLIPTAEMEHLVVVWIIQTLAVKTTELKNKITG